MWVSARAIERAAHDALSTQDAQKMRRRSASAVACVSDLLMRSLARLQSALSLVSLTTAISTRRDSFFVGLAFSLPQVAYSICLVLTPFD